MGMDSIRLSKPLQMADIYETIKAFTELTEWEFIGPGFHTAKWDKDISFDIDYNENDTFQREQDCLFISHKEYYREYFDDFPCCGMDEEFILKHCEYNNYKSNIYISVPLGWIVEYLRERGILPWSDSLILTNIGF